MTFEEFEKATDEDLTLETKRCFDLYTGGTIGGGDRPALLLEAQFYMQELGRREDARVASRDYGLEIWVILLIGIEIILSLAGIGLAIYEGRHDDLMMSKQNGILTNLQRSTADSANAIKNLADLTKTMADNTSASSNSLSSLKATTERMNQGVQDQLNLFYEPSVVGSFSSPTKQMQVFNTGRTAVELWGSKFRNDSPVFFPVAQVMPPGEGYTFRSNDFFGGLEQLEPKGSTVMIPLELYIKTQRGKKFVAHLNLAVFWQDNVITVFTQLNGIAATEWSKP